jgi:hypothetical protein
VGEVRLLLIFWRGRSLDNYQKVPGGYSSRTSLLVLPMGCSSKAGREAGSGRSSMG